MGQTDKSSTLGMRRSDGRESQRTQLRDATDGKKDREMEKSSREEGPFRENNQ